MNLDGQIEYEEFAFMLMSLLPMEQPEEIRGPFDDVDINSKQIPLILYCIRRFIFDIFTSLYGSHSQSKNGLYFPLFLAFLFRVV